MEPINWLAVILAPNLAVALGLVWHGPLFRTGRPLLPGSSQATGKYGLVLAIFLVASLMLGHSFARIGEETLDAKPWLYFMQSGGIAAAFVVPAVWLSHLRAGTGRRAVLVDLGFWLVAYLVMGLTFWALG